MYLIQAGKHSSRRTAILRPRRYPDCHRGLQVQCPHAMLQGFGHRLRTLGSTIYKEVYGGTGKGNGGGARGDEEEKEALDAQGRCD